MKITDTGDHIVLEKEEYAQLKRKIDDQEFTIAALKKRVKELMQSHVWMDRIIRTIKGNMDRLAEQSQHIVSGFKELSEAETVREGK